MKAAGKRPDKSSNHDRPRKIARLELLDFPPAESIPEIAGRVIAIELENFMCHGSLKAEFDIENCNCFFIGGANGSGKSAIMAALNIGLGGLSIMSDRGSSLQDYIKHGARLAPRAKISITLSNTGQQHQNEYGEHVIVERTFTPTTSTYKLKSIHGGKGMFLTSQRHLNLETVVSSRKKDIDRLLVRFGIQLRNPIFWMTQDRCRTFLQEMRPDKLYSAFVQATGIDQVRDSYIRLGTSLEEICTLRKNFVDYTMSIKRDYSSMKARYERALLVEKQKKDLSELQWVMCWLPYRDAMKQANKRKLEYEEVVRKLERSGQVHSEKQKEKAALEVKKEVLRKEVTSTVGDLQQCGRESAVPLTQLLQQLAYLKEEEKGRALAQRMQELSNAKKCWMNKKRELEDIQSEISAMERLIEDIEKKKMEEQSDTKMHHLRASLAEFDSKITDLLSNEGHLENERAVRKTKLATAEAEASRLKVKLKECVDALTVAREKQDRARAMEQDRMGRFGSSMLRIVRLVEANASLFKRKPIGPIGNYVRVLEERYELAVEVAFSALLRAFVCDNWQDNKTFEKLLRNHNIKPPIRIISKFTNERYKTETHEPAAGLVTVLRQIEVSETNVFNALVDQLRIESILLLDDDNYARHLMSSEPPRNARKAFTVSGAEVIAKSNLRPYAFYVNVRPENGFRILSRSQSFDSSAVAAEIAVAEEALTRARSNFAEARGRYEKAYKEFTTVTARLEKAQQEVENERIQKRRCERELEVAEVNEGVDTRLINIKNCVDEYRAKEVSVKAEMEEKLRRVKICEEKCRTAEEDGKATKMKLDGLRMKVSSQESELAEKVVLSERVEVEVARLHQTMLRLETKKKELQAELDVVRVEIEKTREEARECDAFQRPSFLEDPPDVDQLPDAKSVREEHAAIKGRIEAFEKSSQEVVTADVLQATKTQYKQSMSELRMIEDIYQVP
ncbi:unnamed protein product [Toxocara canis]|uniref:AAA_23 domain-containing protein n=1 Tax=Toxocara canis TaxID=6265 RepID=A0A183UF94_TOXCA|nr:unnamed protein product [Toxocara canis]